MPILDNWDLNLSIDQVLEAQGADPKAIRIRRPRLISATEEAIKRGILLLHPIVLYEKYTVNNFRHERLELKLNGQYNSKLHLSGPLITQHLAQAQEIIILLCTIGHDLDDTVSSLFKVDPVTAVALDGVGSAAVEMLAIQACNYFESQIKDTGLEASIPLNPGMVGWSVDVGQPEIFSLLDSEEINVSLTESCMMVPNKSLSMVLGIGKNMITARSPCEFCNLNGICKYKNHYAK